MHVSVRAVLPLAAAAICVASPAAGAQSLECIRPQPADGQCVVVVATPEAKVTVSLQVADRGGKPPAPVDVTFSAPAGGMVTASQRSDAAGVVVATWEGRVDAPVTIVASATVDGMAIKRNIVIKPPPPKSAYTLTPLHFPDLKSTLRPDYWYAERQIGEPYGVVVENVAADSCAQVLVLFRQTSSGAVTPDSVYARWVARDQYADATILDRIMRRSTSDKTKACIAVARWKLGKEVGEHHLRVGLPGEPSKTVEFRARARALPRLIAGLAFTNVGGYDRTTSLDSTFKVTRTTPTGEVVFDSVKKVQTFAPFAGQWEFNPVVGVDWPIKTSWSNVRTSVSASIKSGRTDWFAGLSILQLLQGYVQEGVGMDLQGVLHVSKRDIVVNGSACATQVATCVSESRTGVVGYGVILTVDTSLLSVITSAFGVK